MFEKMLPEVMLPLMAAAPVVFKLPPVTVPVNVAVPVPVKLLAEMLPETARLLPRLMLLAVSVPVVVMLPPVMLPVAVMELPDEMPVTAVTVLPPTTPALLMLLATIWLVNTLLAFKLLATLALPADVTRSPVMFKLEPVAAPMLGVVS